MKTFKIVIIVFCVLAFQTVINGYISIFGINPNFALISVVVLSILYPDYKYMGIVAVITGLILDFITSGVFGLNTLLLLYVSQLTCYFAKQFLNDNFMSVLLITFLGTVLFESIYYLFNSINYISFNLIKAFVRIVLPAGLYNAVISMIVYPIIKKYVSVSK